MLLELTSPCFLPVGLTRSDGQLAWFGLTLKFPIVQLRAQAHPDALLITGPRANLARAQAARFAAQRGRDYHAEIEIEWAIPSHMGLSSETMLGLSVARALMWAAEESMEDSVSLARDLALDDGAATCGFQHGGALLVSAEGEPHVLRRAAPAPAPAEDGAWVFVLYLPRPPEDAPPIPEPARARAVIAAAPHLSREAEGVLNDSIWPAFAQDDRALFAQGLKRLSELTHAALSAASTPVSLSEEARAVLEVMHAEGALACGQALTGLGMFALVPDTETSHVLRNKILAYVGHFGGTLLASVLAEAGAQQHVKAERLQDGYIKPIVMGNLGS
jgi:predicted sugar kinase